LARSVTHDGTGWLRIRFTYDPRLVGAVKSLSNRRWSPADKQWVVPDVDVVAVVELLHPEGFQLDAVVCRMYRERGGSLPVDAGAGSFPSAPGLFDALDPETAAPVPANPAPAAPVTDLTVSALNERVRDVLEGAFPAPIWIVGEISGFNKSAHKKHVTFHLVERGDDQKDLAQVGATLFEGARRELEQKLARAGDPFRLEDEITVRMLCRVELYVPWGSYRLVVEDLDPAYTLGEAARRCLEIVRKLTEEGLLERNLALPFPALPLRVAFVTSLGSDAYNDVLRTLRESGFAFALTAHGARVQGRSTEASVANALDWIGARASEFDVVLICRGGGSRSDLAWLDSELLARAVAGFPIPVVVGIGHEQDVSVLDFVGRRAKTPTAAAALLVERVERTHAAVEQLGLDLLLAAAQTVQHEERRQRERDRRLSLSARALLSRERLVIDGRRERAVRAARARIALVASLLARTATAFPREALRLLDKQSVMLTHAAGRLKQSTRRDAASLTQRLADLAQRFGAVSQRRLATEAERTESRARRLHLIDPRRVVERGYAILRAADGAVIRDAAQAPAGTKVEAELGTGTLVLRSEGTRKP